MSGTMIADTLQCIEYTNFQSILYDLRSCAMSVTDEIGVISRSGVLLRRKASSSHNAGVLSRLYLDDVTLL